MEHKDLKNLLAEFESKKEKKTLVYYCNAGGGGFFVKLVDENGEYIPKTHPTTGQPVYDKNKKLYQDYMETWVPIVATRSIHADAISCKKVESDEDGAFTHQQKELILVLEEMANNQSSQVMREEDYKKGKNPVAYEREVELKRLQDSVAEREETAFETGVQEGKKEFLSEMDKLKRQLAETEGELKGLREKPRKPKKSGKK